MSTKSTNRAPVRETTESPVRHDAEGDADLLQAPQTDQVRNAREDCNYLLVKRRDVDKYLSPRQYGAPSIGYRTCPAWEVVKEGDPEEQGRKFADQGAPMDSAKGHGETIMLRILKKDWESSVGWFREQQNLAKERRLFTKTVEKDGGYTKLTTVVTSGPDQGRPTFEDRSV